MADLPRATPTHPAPATTQSRHRDFLEGSIPDWLINATPQRRQELKQATPAMPDWYRRATPAQRKVLHDSFSAGYCAQTRLDKAMASLQGIDAFAQPLLAKALKDQYQVELDLNTTLLQLKKTIEVGVFAIDIGSFEVLRLPLLQAALHNFEAWECEPGAFHSSSGFLTQQAAGVVPLSTTLTVAQFTRLCRDLDVGAQYQAYLKSYLQPADSVAEQALRAKFIGARKAALGAAAEHALLTQDITPADYRMLQAVINDDFDPSMGDKQVWFRDLGLMNKRMTGCVGFSLCAKYHYPDEVILYIPDDPEHPLKRYTWAQMKAVFKRNFTARDTPDPGDGSPTTYQRFFSRFVAYGDLAEYFGQLTDDAPAASAGQALAPYASLLNSLANGINPFSVFTGIKELPPTSPRARVANLDPFLAPVTLTRKGYGLWDANGDLWQYLFEQHRDKMLADARNHAVPTADVDAKVRSEKLARLLNIGMLVLNAVSMFVPVLGEVMMVVMAGQLLYETFEGAVEWSMGDRKAAKAHLVDVAENLALLGVMAGAGKGLARLAAVKPEPLIEGLAPVTLPDGGTRLWQPDLSAYEAPVTLAQDAAPNPRGQFLLEGKTYIRQAGKVYESSYDPALQRWRIKHPSDPHAYQPLLTHNGVGAWRHTLERPQGWDRLTLLRRLGPMTEGFSDEQLLNIADISTTDDSRLRQVHLDNAPPPPELTDALRLFQADQDVAQVIEQVSTGQAVDGRYLYTLPLMTELPRWPAGRLLEVFDGPGFTGRSQKYGTEREYLGIRRKPVIRVSRAQVLSGQLPTQILAALDESEIVDLLGGEPARVHESRPEAFRKQIADYARSRQPALFDSLYRGTEPKPPMVAKLQRLYPGLSEPAAQALLAETDVEQLTRLRDTGRVPLHMQERARGYVRQGRLGHAYAGLHMENMASADSKRLALHTLETLPGWSDQVRLEVREGSIEGALLDSIGSESAAQRKYLVKRGPLYQAFNARGEALNSLARYGDNFYASIMHALPDEARQALGIPHVGQSPQLRRAIIDHAVAHRLQSAQIVEGYTRGQPWFKPPQRIAPGRIGYPASGGFEGNDLNPLLVSRVRDVYPNMTDDQANGFILRMLLENQSDQQIFNFLQRRQREWQTLEATLDRWQIEAGAETERRLFTVLGGKLQIVRAIKRCWRGSLLAELPQNAELDVFTDEPLPALTADFSHVRTLSLGGRGITDATIGPVLGYFPSVETLRLAAVSPALSSVPEALASLPGLTSLKVYSTVPFTAPELTRLSTLTRLRHLNLEGAFAPEQVLDVSRLTELRGLRVSRAYRMRFPAGVFHLPHLERLDLKGAGIDALPPELFEPGRERFWSGLSLDWSLLTREHFRPAYEYVISHQEHVMDVEEMVRGYCEGELIRLQWLGAERLDASSVATQRKVLLDVFFARWNNYQARYDAIEALSTEYAELSRQLNDWSRAADSAEETLRRSVIVPRLGAGWYSGVLRRYGSTQASSTLVLRSLTLNELPFLPTEGFAHIDNLQLASSRVPAAQLGRFIEGFDGLRSLDLSDCGLAQLPVAAQSLASLEHLNLGKNPLAALDVSAMPHLRSLDLSGTAQAWPVGVETLAQLTWLDLRDSLIRTLPPSALSRDSLLLASNLSGTALDAATRSTLATALQRVEQRVGLMPGSLERFAFEDVSQEFPPAETGATLIDRLLPLLPVEPGAGALTLEQRLQRLHPTLENSRVQAWAQHLRTGTAGDLHAQQRVVEWEQRCDALTRHLNDWLYIRETRSTGLLISSQARRWAALRILECWRNGLLAWGGEVERTLVLEGMQLGDLPELPVQLAHVDTLNLTGVRLTEQGSNAFLRAFPQLRTLVLNGNLLVDLPSVLGEMTRLERLELASNQIMDAQALDRALANLRQLRWLDLSHCNLQTFQVGTFERLETLDLRNNRLTDWPEGVLQRPSLRSLNLSANELEIIPPLALEGDHDLLMQGTDLTDNWQMPREALERIRDYAERTQRDHPLGFTRLEIRRRLEDFDNDSDGAAGEAEVESDEDLAPVRATPEQRGPWFDNLAPQTLEQRQALWDQLEAEPDNAAFFNLLSTLRDTGEFRVARADLTRRVWAVITAAGSDGELRQTLFALSNTHGTCVDGRILTFSGLEVKVFEHNTLLGIDPARLDLKGPALLKLSRQLFRLDKVEALAAAAMGRGSDAAEVRLEYRIGLQARLDLPAQPAHMTYGRPITGQVLEKAVREVQQAESSDAFYEDLISRDYWVDYLKQKYPDSFTAQERVESARRDQVESEHQQIDQAYAEALNTVDIELTTARNQMLLDLSRTEAQAQATDQPGPSRGMP